MKQWVILLSLYNIKVVEAEDAGGAAKAFATAFPDGVKRKTSGKSLSRSRFRSIRVVDVEGERVREFQLTPPPESEWMIEEVQEDDDEEPDEDD